MYNSIILFDKKNDYCWTQFLLTNQEFEEIKSLFYWVVGPEDFVVPYEDYFTEIQLILFKNNFPSICNDFSLENYFITFHSGIYFFSIKEYLENKFYPISKGATKTDYTQLVPSNGRPKFEYTDDFILEWYHEYGLYKKYKVGKESYSWFLHPITMKHLFKNETEYDSFIKNQEQNMKKSHEVRVNEDDLFIRVINVYDKITKELKYRIINDEFNRSALDSIIEPYERDEILLFRSYKINSEIAKYIQEMYSNPIDFNFKKNEYYLETLSAKDFIYSYEDLINNLDTIE